jgi:thiamine-monophosphate kinase
MAGEFAFIERLRAIANHPAARGLLDDVAVLDIGAITLVLTHDSLVEGVHFLATDPPESVAWKLLAVNLSDLTAKGATPIGALMGHTLIGDAAWDAAFADGLEQALTHFDVPLLGGDTVRASERHLAMTLIGGAAGPVPSRAGAREGDGLFVTGCIGDPGAGLDLLRRPRVGEGRWTDKAPDARSGPRLREGDELVTAYQRPEPQLAAGQALAPVVTAMMDISDGLLIDAQRLAEASGLAAMIDLDAVPLSAAFKSVRGEARAARLFATTAGDDYQLLFTAADPLPPLPCPVTRIGTMVSGHGIHLHDSDGGVPLPPQLGWQH